MRFPRMQRAARAVIIAATVLLAISRGSTGAAASHEVFQAIDQFVLERMEALKIPGAAIGIVRGSETTYVKGYGVADGTGRTMTADTPFLIASLTKPITAVAVMQLVEAGKIELDAPVQTYLPWFTTADPDAAARITIRHLLHHTSGFSEVEGYKRNLNTDTAHDALEQSIRRLREAELGSAPGDAFEYSNTNYDILGLVIAVTSGQTYEQYVEEKIFAPLDMDRSYTSLDVARAGGMTQGYYPFFGHPVAYDALMPYSEITKPSAGLFSSAEDLTHFLIAQMNEGQYADSWILSAESTAQLQTAGTDLGHDIGYAMGWTVFPFTDLAQAMADGTAPMGISHAGEWAGYTSLLVFVPELDTGVVMLLNKSDPARMPDLHHIGWSLAMLSVGLAPVQPTMSDFVTRNSRMILGAAVILLGAGLVWSLRAMRGLGSNATLDHRRWRRLAIQMLVLLVADLIIAGWLLLIQLPENKETLHNLLREKPDIGLLCASLVALTLGWGAVRSAVFGFRLSRTAPGNRGP